MVTPLNAGFRAGKNTKAGRSHTLATPLTPPKGAQGYAAGNTPRWYALKTQDDKKRRRWGRLHE